MEDCATTQAKMGRAFQFSKHARNVQMNKYQLESTWRNFHALPVQFKVYNPF